MRKMSLRVTAALVAIALATGLWLGQSYAASNALDPGSAQDPLVTRTYVDQEIAKLKESLSNSGTGTGTGGGTETPGNVLEIVVVPKGQQLTGYEGTEFILRSGTARAVASAAGGLSNLTDGKNIPSGATIPLDNLILFPRSDGRGFRAVSEIIVLVRGKWSIDA